ncbi:hypothetical protein [Paenibacillus tepidiphilus]|uniref:hypothetical protein n=1 Tax=Paenibacillus tepidiphilus TaxID=2608683 RepID=UPI00123AB2B6|nr:hypothetical protein [Paenibacillus tepidiphilus]
MWCNGSSRNSRKDDIALKKRLSSEQGSVLVLVMFIVLLLTIMGVGVLSATVGGARRAETRENDVQSLHLAQKKIDEVIAYMTERLNLMLMQGADTPQNELNNKIQTFLTGLENQAGEFKSATNLDGAANQITSITLDKSASTGSQYAIVIRANAIVNGVSRNLEQRVTVTTFPDFLNYSLGSSEGDVILNGAPYIKGNVYAGGELKLSPVAEYTHNGADLTQPSLFPLIEGEPHIQNLNSIQYWNGGGYTKVPSGDEEQYQLLDNRVKQAYENSLIKKKATFVQIDVEDSFLDKMAEASGAENNKSSFATTYYGLGGKGSGEEPKVRGGRLVNSLINNRTLPVLKMPERSDYENDHDEEGILTGVELENWREQQYQSAFQAWKTKLANLSTSVIYDGSLFLNGNTLNNITDVTKANRPQDTGSSTIPSNWLIINGDLKIVNDTHSKVVIQANLLVTGDLFIEGDVQFDSTLFTLGKTEIINASITGKDEKELVLISKGSILLNRVDEFKDKNQVTELEAFFYTDSTADLYGVGSIFSLNGGFFARGTLTINAVAGEVSERTGQSKFEFEDQQHLTDPEDSRFIIDYNEAVFEHQKIGLPRVKQININAGPVELKPL